MEPMTLGSPSGSPAGNTNYLPSFLMGDQTPTTPRNTLSPNKAGRNVVFAATPVNTSPQDFNRFGYAQKNIFGGLSFPQSSSAHLQNHNISTSGPPTQGLFDTLREEKTQVPNQSRNVDGSNIVRESSMAFGYNIPQNYGFNDSYLNNSSFNAQSAMSPLNTVTQNTPKEFWVTVFGFPPGAAATVLQHFSKCGIILDKVFPPQNGNWVHIKYSSRLECDKALNFNEKIIGNIMIGVTNCREKGILDKENICESRTPLGGIVRPLTHSAYKTMQNENSVVASPNTPQKSTGLVNKAMDLIFGW